MTLKKLKEKTSMNRDIKSTKMEIADIYCRDIQKKCGKKFEGGENNSKKDGRN